MIFSFAVLLCNVVCIEEIISLFFFEKLSLYFQCGYLDPAFGHCDGGGSNRIPVAALNGLVAGRWIAGVGCGSASRQIRPLGRVIALVLRHHTLSLTWMIRFCSIC